MYVWMQASACMCKYALTIYVDICHVYTVYIYILYVYIVYIHTCTSCIHIHVHANVNKGIKV